MGTQEVQEVQTIKNERLLRAHKCFGIVLTLATPSNEILGLAGQRICQRHPPALWTLRLRFLPFIYNGLCVYSHNINCTADFFLLHHGIHMKFNNVLWNGGSFFKDFFRIADHLLLVSSTRTNFLLLMKGTEIRNFN